MPIFLFGIICFILSVFSYLLFFSRRLCSVFGFSYKEKKIRIIRIVASVAISALTVAFFGYGIVFLLYMALSDALLSLIIAVVKRCGKELPSLWKKIHGSGVVPVVLSLVVVIFGYINFHNIVKTEYTIYTDKNIREEGYKVAFISDVHFGISLDISELSEVCREISREKPDVVILGGDIVDNSTPATSYAPLFETFGGIESEFGVYYIFGNHDRSMKMVQNAVSEDELEALIEASGIEILCDEVKEINGDFALIGRNDRGFDGMAREDIATLVSKTDKARFLLTLDHQPTEYEKNGEAGVDLIISGHTHGGQIWPIDIMDKIFKFNEANYGCVDIDRDTKAIVSSGLAGWGFEVKTSAPAEYVIVNIKRKFHINKS